MATPTGRRQSLLFLLVWIIVATVVVVFGIHSAHLYFSQRDAMNQRTRLDAAESLARLTKTIAPFIEAYAVNDYDKLIATEIELRQHYAIVVHDLNMGKVLGEDEYISGKIRGKDGLISDFDHHDPAQQQQLESVYFSDSAQVRSTTGEPIGSISVYITDEAMQQELHRVFRDSMVATTTMALLLIVSLLFFSLRLFIRPLVQIAKAIEQRDSDGIPVSPAPDLHYREVSALTDTINSMLDVIRHSRDSLQLERARLKNVIDGANAGTWEWDVQTGELFINERWAQMLGYTREELAPTTYETWGNNLHPDDVQPTLALLEQHLSGTMPEFRVEIRMRHKLGHWVWILAMGRVAKRTEDHQPLLMSGTHIDISENKQTEADLRESKIAAEAANVAKSRFLTTMSHEIRTPMNGILGMAQLLLNSPMTEVERKDCARTVLNSGQTLLTLLNDILDLSKVEAGKLTLEEGIIEPEQLLHETQTLFNDSARNKGLVISSDWSGETGQRYRGDPHRVRQMLANLVNNAIKFTTQGRIEMQSRELAVRDKEIYLEFSVTDTGLGIPADKLDQLFKPFSQADSSTARLFGGSGLGLSIVHNLAQLMGGEVGVDSHPGQGSRFWFRIRSDRLTSGAESRQVSRDTGSAQTLPPPRAVLQGRVLIVEDKPSNQFVIRSLLEKMGIATIAVDNGEQAIALIESGNENIDALLMDLQMPVLDGYAATERIRAWEVAHQRPRMPIIALTADAFPAIREHCLSIGMDAFLSKPVIAEDLAAVLGKWLTPADTRITARDSETSTGATLDVEAFMAHSADLLPMLKQGKYDAVDRFRELEMLAEGTMLSADLNLVRQDIQEFQFERALARLSRLRDTLAATKGMP